MEATTTMKQIVSLYACSALVQLRLALALSLSLHKSNRNQKQQQQTTKTIQIVNTSSIKDR